MTRPMRVFIVICAIMGVSAIAHAQSSPIPATRVPGFGGSDTRPSSPGGSPASSGSNVGSNVGAGATASPSAEIIAPARTSDEALVTPPAGTSGSLTITK